MLFHLTIANLKILLRNRQSLFWALAFPLIFVTVFGLFRLDRPSPTQIMVVDNAKDELSVGLIDNLRDVSQFKVEVLQDEASARAELESGNAGYAIILPKGLDKTIASGDETSPIAIALLYDQGRQTAPIIISSVRRVVQDMNIEITQAPILLRVETEELSGKHRNYFDYLLPGFVGMGVMNYAIIGIASTMSLYRQQRVLKRMLATPLKIRTFFLAQIVSYLLLSIVQASVIMAAGIILFNGHIYGNWLWLFLLVIIGNIIFLNIGFIVGGIVRNVAAAAGLGNAVAVPMMFFSGVFFPTENLPRILEVSVRYLPLTPMLTAMRGVALEAKNFWAYPTELALLGAWIILTAVIAVRVFKFE